MNGLTDVEKFTVICALHAAANKYLECASFIGISSNMRLNVRDSLVSQFNKQAADCVALVEKFED